MVEPPRLASMCALHPSVYAVGACPRCGSFACADCLVALPDGSQICRPCQERRSSLPWDHRPELGWWRAFWRTSVAVLTHPQLTFGTMPKDGTLGSSLGFTALSQAFSFLTTLGLYMVAFVVMMFLNPEGAAFKLPFGRAGATVGAILVSVLVFFFYFAMLAVLAVLWQLFIGSFEHLLLRLLGGKASWNQTMRGYSVAMGPSVVGLVPLCGLYVFPVVSMGMRVIAYRHVHQVSWARAAVGALAPTGAFVALLLGLWTVLSVLWNR